MQNIYFIMAIETENYTVTTIISARNDTINLLLLVFCGEL